MKTTVKLLSFFLFFLSVFFSCNVDEYLETEEVDEVTLPSPTNSIKGFYLFNEGNMGMNRASIDYFDYETGYYHRNIYPSRNPSQVKELGDVGNDIQVYKERLYAVVNVSGYVEVMDLAGRHIKGVEIPNCRYIVFMDDKAYISSYATPVSIDPNAGKGLVFELDLNSLEITRKVQVGYQPEQMVIYNDKLYVANSGGYRAPHYDRTISVVDINSFKEIKKIDVEINLHRMLPDNLGNIYITSRGNYKGVEPSLLILDLKTEKIIRKMNLPVSEMCLLGNLIYYYGVSFSYNTGKNEVSYGIIDTDKQEVVSDRIITDGTEKQIMMPYGLAINTETKEIYITDAQDYVVTGVLYCFSPKGKLLWRTFAGNIPAHIAFVSKNN